MSVLEVEGVPEFLKPQGVNATLSERGKSYGVYSEQAKITQNINTAMRNSKNWNRLTADKADALEMIALKIARILNGDPEYKDSWHDIQGYAKLIEDTLGE